LLNIPPFLNGQPQLSAEDEANTRKIASVRVHVERAIARVKNYRILRQVIPLTLAENLEQIWSVCSYLTLTLPPIIKDKQSYTVGSIMSLELCCIYISTHKLYHTIYYSSGNIYPVQKLLSSGTILCQKSMSK
jgi:hypothetical protein